MALNHSLKQIVSSCSQILSRQHVLFETPFIFGCNNVINSRQKRVWVQAPKVKYPLWYLKQERQKYNENLTKDNAEFIKDVVHDTFGSPVSKFGIQSYESPVKLVPLEPREPTSISKRTGLIGKNIGRYPLWMKNGEKVWTTLIQVCDNHVVKYIPPEEFDPPRKKIRKENNKSFGCLLVGAETGDPSVFTKEYCGLFKDSGVPPKKKLVRFVITPDAQLPPGTPLVAAHFRPNAFLDVRGVTIDRGFQGVMKRWGFKGLPATHGVTKSHRRPGCIAGGAGKAKVYKGKKMPGHMGNRWRFAKGVEILRINTKYNVLWLKSTAIPGATGSYVYLYDSILPSKKKLRIKLGLPPHHFPTYIPGQDDGDELPEELCHKDLHQFTEPSIVYTKEK